MSSQAPQGPGDDQSSASEPSPGPGSQDRPEGAGQADHLGPGFPPGPPAPPGMRRRPGPGGTPPVSFDDTDDEHTYRLTLPRPSAETTGARRDAKPRDDAAGQARPPSEEPSKIISPDRASVSSGPSDTTSPEQIGAGRPLWNDDEDDDRTIVGGLRTGPHPLLPPPSSAFTGGRPLAPPASQPPRPVPPGQPHPPGPLPVRGEMLLDTGLLGAPDESSELEGQTARRGDRFKIIAGVTAAAVLVGAAVVGGIALTGGGEETTTASPAPSAPVGESGGAPRNAPEDAPADAAPETAPAEPTGSPEEVLRAVLNPVTMTGCQAPETGEGRYTDAALRCTSLDGVEVTAYHFPSRSALDRRIGAQEAYYNDEGTCDDLQQSMEEWSSPAEPGGGTRLCYYYADLFVTFWTIDDERLAFTASDPDPARLMAWWRNFDPIRRR